MQGDGAQILTGTRTEECTAAMQRVTEGSLLFWAAGEEVYCHTRGSGPEGGKEVARGR